MRPGQEKVSRYAWGEAYYQVMKGVEPWLDPVQHTDRLSELQATLLEQIQKRQLMTTFNRLLAPEFN